MNQLVFEQMAREHVRDLRREAAGYADRAASRADRARPRVARRVARAIGTLVPHGRPSVVGCEA